MKQGEHSKPLLYLTYLTYDETPLQLRAQYGPGQAYVHNTKNLVFQQEWHVLLQQGKQQTDHEQHQADGERKFSVDSCFLIHAGASLTCMWRILVANDKLTPLLSADAWPVRVCETDEAGANLRAEALWRVANRDVQQHTLHIVCNAHKCHIVAQRLWNQFDDLHGGLIKSLKVLKSPEIGRHSQMKS